MRRPWKLSTYLALNHAVLLMAMLVVLGGTLWGMVRMLALMADVRDQHLSRLDVEEELHRRAWAVEIALRYGSVTCSMPDGELAMRNLLEEARRALLGNMETSGAVAPPELRAALGRYVQLSDAALAGPTCAFLARPETQDARTRLDEDLTNAWIRRLHDLHGEIKAREEEMRSTGTGTAAVGVLVALVAAAAATVIARATARRVTEPVARLARAATGLGQGQFEPIPQEHAPLEVVALWRDMERLRVRLLESDRVKSAFLASVSHELRTPLGRLREALALLTDGTCGPLAPQQARVGGIAARACEREVRLVNALLDLSRLHAGEPLKLCAGCDVDRIIQDALEDERSDAEEQRVALEFSRSGPAPTAELDPALLERAVANLVRNAVSVTPRDGVVRVVRRVDGDAQGPRRVEIEVCDAGPGLPPSIRDGAFRPFGAAPVPGSSRPSGIGIGLSLARDVARAHGGNLSVVATGAQGTTLRLDLPTAQVRA